MVEVSLDLQEDKIPTKKRTNHVRWPDRPAYENTDDVHKYPQTTHPVTFLGGKKRKDRGGAAKQQT